jgi:hypothetical protein
MLVLVRQTKSVPPQRLIHTTANGAVILAAESILQLSIQSYLPSCPVVKLNRAVVILVIISPLRLSFRSPLPSYPVARSEIAFTMLSALVLYLKKPQIIKPPPLLALSIANLHRTNTTGQTCTLVITPLILVLITTNPLQNTTFQSLSNHLLHLLNLLTAFYQLHNITPLTLETYFPRPLLTEILTA